MPQYNQQQTKFYLLPPSAQTKIVNINSYVASGRMKRAAADEMISRIYKDWSPKTSLKKITTDPRLPTTSVTVLVDDEMPGLTEDIELIDSSSGTPEVVDKFKVSKDKDKPEDKDLKRGIEL